MSIPRVVVAGTGGGSGKTLLSVGLVRALVRRGMRVAPFKKGPDYIDAAWLSLAAGRDCTNLDPFFCDAGGLRTLFVDGAAGADVAVIEGNRGLYDGLDAEGSCSTAELARTLGAPVVLSLNCTKMTRTAAAVVTGLASFEQVDMGGVVLSQVRGPRHEAVIRESMARAKTPPVLGAVGRLPRNPIPERHMGLVAASAGAEGILDGLADLIERSVDVQGIVDVAARAGDLPDRPARRAVPPARPGRRPRIGFVRDQALWFVYPQNLRALSDAGADVVRLSLLDGTPWPHVDGIYLVGGFPELYARQLAASPKIRLLGELSRQGMPVYAECGGFMVLCDAIVVGGEAYGMAGVFPTSAEFTASPQGLGYVTGTVTGANPFLPEGMSFRGHEFHYSRCRGLGEIPACLTLAKGSGMGRSAGGAVDGFLVRNTFASYTHLFAPAVPAWAPGFVAACSGRA